MAVDAAAIRALERMAVNAAAIRALERMAVDVAAICALERMAVDVAAICASQSRESWREWAQFVRRNENGGAQRGGGSRQRRNEMAGATVDAAELGEAEQNYGGYRDGCG
jgi:hypothetical protein